jgi:hypothetical protein
MTYLNEQLILVTKKEKAIKRTCPPTAKAFGFLAEKRS